MKKKAIAASALATMALLGASKQANAAANLIPAIKAGGGWVTVVSYINTQAPAGTPSQVFVHATYQVKNPNNFTERCVHLDGRSTTTQNDLTTTVISTFSGGAGSVFPAADTVGSAIITPPAPATGSVSEGFLVLENYDGTRTRGAIGTLTSEAIVFNLTAGFLYSQRALAVTHVAASPNGDVHIEVPNYNHANYLIGQPFSANASTINSHHQDATLSRFMFLPPATATTGAYVIAINRLGTKEDREHANSTNLVSADYNARIRLDALMDSAQGYALGIYNRLEDFRSITQRADIVCLAQVPPTFYGATIPGFIVNGGWFNLSPRCIEEEVAGTFTECDGDGNNQDAVDQGTEFGDAAIIYKVEFAPGYGFAVTPQHQQWYVK